ncbi:phage antirepressor KilAC domain-containing protein [Undibacterium sp. SXout7W]|uniref:phage antirepressor KilAC domain-containing protein n=1 Tax=Undibacterium sp. SXout7W TaxID=3413049 RepID=UPI003BEF8C74
MTYAITQIINGEPMTTTLTIASQTMNDHASVIKLARTYQSDLSEFGLVGFEIQPRLSGQHGGGDAEYACLNEQQATLLLTYMRNSEIVRNFKKALVKAFYEMRKQVSPPSAIPTSFSAALRLAAEQQETIEQQNAKLEAAAPAVEFVEKYVDSTGLKSFRQVCKLLNVKENDFRAFLMARNIMYRLGGEWVPYSHHIDAGRFVVKAGTADSGHAFNSAKFTSKGIEWVAGEFAKFQVHECEATA